MKNNLIYISRGDPQPTPCHECGELAGYSCSDRIGVRYITVYGSDGQHESGRYSEYEKSLSVGTFAYCANCGAKLNFKLNRQ